jgi:hypothetical protein
MTVLTTMQRTVQRTVRKKATPRTFDLIAVTTFVLGALWVTAKLWRDPAGRLQASNLQDQVFFEWVLGHGLRSLTSLENPLFTDRLNLPDGVNMMANTNILGLSLPLSPITWLFGAPITYAALLTFGFAATATAWYWVFSRHVVSSPVAATIGALFCGFAPGMVSQGNGHPNLVAQFMLPLIVWRVMKLGEPGRALRNGIVLGLMITYQMFINEEMIFLSALGCGVFLLAYALPRWQKVKSQAGTFLRGLGVTAAVTLTLLAYPLYHQFFGPQHYNGIPVYTHRFRTDLASFWTYATESLVGDHSGATAIGLGAHPAEENTFFGFALLIVVPFLLWLGRRHPLAVPAALTAVFFGVLSLGHEIMLYGAPTGIAGPWALLEKLPIFDSVVPIRLGLKMIPAIGLIIAIGADRAIEATRETRSLRVMLAAVLAAALLPPAPTPLPIVRVPGVPEFISGGAWKEFVPGDRSMVTVPPSDNYSLYGMRWAADQGLGFRLGQGYFLGPGGPEGRATYPAPPTPTSDLLDAIAEGEQPVIGPAEIRAARTDLVRWRAALLVLDPAYPRADALKRATDQLVGPGRAAGGVWMWDVREISQ